MFVFDYFFTNMISYIWFWVIPHSPDRFENHTETLARLCSTKKLIWKISQKITCAGIYLFNKFTDSTFKTVSLQGTSTRLLSTHCKKLSIFFPFPDQQSLRKRNDFKYLIDNCFVLVFFIYSWFLLSFFMFLFLYSIISPNYFVSLICLCSCCYCLFLFFVCFISLSFVYFYFFVSFFLFK